MALIPKIDTLKDLIEKGMVELEDREYIGISGLAGPCSRKIWYDFHWANTRKVPKRIKRIFERGDLEEPRVVKDLENAGMTVQYVLNNQLEVVDDTGHIKGHPDGEVLNVPTAPKTRHLLEIKTMNNKIFKNYVKQGLERAHPTYWGQVHTYMGERKLTRCLFVVTNKDNEERHYERIKYNPEVHRETMSRGLDILTSEFPPKKIGEATWFECKMCDSIGICHKAEPINRHCRTCEYVNIEMHGLWSCGNPAMLKAVDVDILVLDRGMQEAGCTSYELAEAFK